MYLRRIDEIEYKNDNNFLITCCGHNCVGFYRESKLNHRHFFCCIICGALYQRVFSFTNEYNPKRGTVFQICFDDDNPELDIMKRYLSMGDNACVFSVKDPGKHQHHKNGKLIFKDGQLKIITTNEKDVFAYGKNRCSISTEDVIFGRE